MCIRDRGFKLIYDYLSTHADGDRYAWAMVGFLLGNTVSTNGSVSRGVCVTDADHNLVKMCIRDSLKARVQAALGDLGIVGELVSLENDLDGLIAAAVGQRDKADIFRIAHGFCPAADSDLGTCLLYTSVLALQQ